MSEQATEAQSATDILKYWLNAVRFEEALTARPRAIRGPVPPGPLNVLDPQGNHTYFKVPADKEAQQFLLGESDSMRLPLVDDRLSFCGFWLNRHYRRQRQRWTVRDEEGLSTMVAWPSIFFPHSDELASPVRFQARLEWYRDDGKRFEPPDRGARRMKTTPKPPTEFVIRRVIDEDGVLLPYALDDRLFLNQLGVSDEELADLYDALRTRVDVSPSVMLQLICSCLESEGEWTAPDTNDLNIEEDELYDRVCQSIGSRLKSSPRAPRLYPLGFVHEGHTIQTTHHLQRDLALTIHRLRTGGPLDPHSPLTGYLRGTALESGWAPLMGQFFPEPLTQDQRDVAEQFLGSRLTGAQGPPGTGKTRLIIDLIAATLVERIRTFASDGVMGDQVLVMASTNNRAVDNVFDPLLSSPVPLGLRAGSQRVTHSRTTAYFDQALRWLNARDESVDPDQELAEALDMFRALDEEIHRLENPRHQLRTSEVKRKEIDQRILELRSLVGDGTPPPSSWFEEMAQVTLALKRLAPRLDSLVRRLEARDLIEARRIWKKIDWASIRDLTSNLDGLNVPSLANVIVEWTAGDDKNKSLLDRVEGAIDALDEIRDALDGVSRQRRYWEQLVDLRSERSAIADIASVETPLDPMMMARRHHRLFEQANRVRLAWMAVHENAVREALLDGREATSERRSIKRLLDQDTGSGRWLQQIFPALGSTLLSLGNVLPTRQAMVERLIIDEGGQCHPAHAVSGILRAQRVLVIGDVHQLEPVIHLGLEDERRVRKASRIDWSDEDILPFQILSNNGNSAQILADRATESHRSLRTHFRCQPGIIDICDRLCGYGLEIQTPMLSQAVAPHILPHPVVVIDTLGQQERLRGSWHNEAERKRVIDVLLALSHAGIPWDEVAVITPYVGQLYKLLDDLRRSRIPWIGQDDGELGFDGQQNGVAVGTVHRFQGGERRVVIFSTVVTREASLGFINERVNLINVAVSRAREHLVVIGHEATLKQGRFSRLLLKSSGEVNRTVEPEHMAHHSESSAREKAPK